MRVYYNEFDKKKCAMLQQLMNDGHITKGDIDDRPIQQVRSEDVKDYDRAHFFAGIGLWDSALDLARWSEDRRVWTGSCPCQPYSTAGRQKGQEDDRHLWPEWLRLIRECKPSAVFGEQVANAVTFGWLDDVYQGLEAEEYAVGSAVLPACSVGAPHKRDRLWFVAYSDNEQQRSTNSYKEGSTNINRSGESTLGNAERERQQRQRGLERSLCAEEVENRETNRLVHDGSKHWQDAKWIDCQGGEQRLVEPSIPLLVDGDSERVGLIHAAGDAIVRQVAAMFIQATI